MIFQSCFRQNISWTEWIGSHSGPFFCFFLVKWGVRGLERNFHFGCHFPLSFIFRCARPPFPRQKRLPIWWVDLGHDGPTDEGWLLFHDTIHFGCTCLPMVSQLYRFSFAALPLVLTGFTWFQGIGSRLTELHGISLALYLVLADF